MAQFLLQCGDLRRGVGHQRLHLLRACQFGVGLGVGVGGQLQTVGERAVPGCVDAGIGGQQGARLFHCGGNAGGERGRRDLCDHREPGQQAEQQDDMRVEHAGFRSG